MLNALQVSKCSRWSPKCSEPPSVRTLSPDHDGNPSYHLELLHTRTRSLFAALIVEGCSLKGRTRGAVTACAYVCRAAVSVLGAVGVKVELKVFFNG